jgi:hypothetical protein
VHAAQYEQHHSHLATESFQNSLQIRRHLSFLQREADITDVDQVKADYKEMIDRVSQRLVAQKTNLPGKSGRSCAASSPPRRLRETLMIR